MDYEKMSLDELKEYAKSLGITVGNIGKEKLINKIKEKENENSMVKSVLNDDDLEAPVVEDVIISSEKSTSLLDSISSVIDDLEDSASGENVEILNLPLNMIVNVKSIRYGGLGYKSSTTNAKYRWNQIGEVQPMTIAAINEMNNHKPDYLWHPFLILMDEKAINYFRLQPVYEKVAKINNLSAVFNSCNLNAIDKVITDALSVNMRDILISKVRQMYKNKKLTDINIITLLEKRLQFDLIDSK